MNLRLVFVISAMLFLSYLKANAGVQEMGIDLRKVDFSQSGMLPVPGVWQFYWNQLLTPEDFLEGRANGGEDLPLPGTWNRQGAHPAIGFATYRMIIKLPVQASGLVLYFPVINSAGKIWINGEMVAESGVVSADQNLYRPRLISVVAEIPPHQAQLDVIIQVVNFTHFVGGFSGTPQIGKTSVLMADLNRSHGVDNFFAGSLIAMFIYQLVLYSLYHRGKSYLWLSLICLGVALRAMIVHHASFLLPNLFPSVSWEIWKKIEFGSVYAIGAIFPLYIYELFNKYAPRWPISIFVAAASGLCGMVLLMPQHVYGNLLDVGHLVLLLAFLYAIIVIVKAWRHGNKDARIILFGVLVSFPFILLEIVKNSLFLFFNFQLMYLVEVGVLVFLLFQIYLLAHHYVDSYRDLESLNTNLEQMVVERTRQLIAANRVRDKLLSVVSHDIKSPLNSLRGILTIYGKGSIDEKEFKHFSRRLEGDLNKTSLLIDNILYWTASQLKGVQVKFEHFNLMEVLTENVELFETVALSKNITIQNEAQESCDVFFDRNILNLSVRNLLSNAIKFSHVGSSIIVHSRHVNGSCEIKVIDFGMGMSPETMDSLQSVHHTQSVDGTSNEKGTGLGLSFCREYLLAAGGLLKIESEVGTGSIFTITIPNKINTQVPPSAKTRQAVNQL